jgi:hypothetical protein
LNIPNHSNDSKIIAKKHKGTWIKLDTSRGSIHEEKTDKSQNQQVTFHIGENL